MITNCLVLYNTQRWGHSKKCWAERTLLLHCPRPLMLAMLSPRALPWHIRPEIIQSFPFAWSFSIIDLLEVSLDVEKRRFASRILAPLGIEQCSWEFRAWRSEKKGSIVSRTIIMMLRITHGLNWCILCKGTFGKLFNHNQPCKNEKSTMLNIGWC